MVPRLLAVLALVAGVVAAVVIALGLGGGGSESASEVASTGSTAARAAPRQVALPSIAPVRNARPQPDWGPYTGAVPILRYHVVGVAPPETRATELFVSPADFQAQMDWLGAHGYQAVGLEAVQRAWSGAGTLPAKPVVLSFDGVRGDLLGTVAPELRRRGWPADLVLDTEEVPLRTAATAKLVALGWDLEPSGEDPAQARRRVRSHLPAPARVFAFPQGRSADSGASALKAAGFVGATTIGGGFGEPSTRSTSPGSRSSTPAGSKASPKRSAATAKGSAPRTRSPAERG